MLEPGIVAVGPHRDEPSGGRRDILGELDRLLAKVQLHDAHVGVEYADQGVVLAADDAKIGKLLELQHVDEEVRRALDISNGEADRFDALHGSRTILRAANRKRQEQEGQDAGRDRGPTHRRARRRWSAHLIGNVHSAAFPRVTFPERCSQGFFSRSRLCAVFTSAMWEKACGKFPNRRFAAGSYSSDSKPRSLRSESNRSNSLRASSSRPRRT